MINSRLEKLQDYVDQIPEVPAYILSMGKDTGLFETLRWLL